MSVAILLVAGGLLAACTPGQEASGSHSAELAVSGQPRIAMAKSYRFEPTALRAPVGSTVTWTNDDNFTHDVHLLAGDGWHSQPLKPGDSVSHVFTQPGEYAFECAFHSQNMKGKLTIGPE